MAIEFDLKGWDFEQNLRPETDRRPPKAVVNDLQRHVDQFDDVELKHAASRLLADLRETVTRRNVAVHTPWESEKAGFYDPASIFFSDAAPPRAIEEFENLADDLEFCVRATASLRELLRTSR